MGSETNQIDYAFLASLLLEIAQQRSLDQLLRILAHRALEGPAASIVVIWLMEKGTGQAGSSGQPYLYAVAGEALYPASASGEPKRFPDFLARVRFGEGPIGRIAATREQVVLNGLDTDPGEFAPVADWLCSAHVRGFGAAPIIHKDEVLGVVGAFSMIGTPEEFRPWARVFANHIAASIANTRAFEEIERLKAQLEEQNAYLREEVIEAKAFGGLVGKSAALGKIVSQIDLVAPTDASVLILGDTGTGKELVAHEIHQRSRRKEKPLVRVNCASVPKDLYESEFFGHARGAFTGAIKDRAGRFETADGGTLFLDEIGEVPLELQGKLLRVLQEKRYERVGEDRTRRADVRIIAATNRDLKEEAEAGRFREDLYYRLNVFPIHVAPLRERKDDIPLLAQHFVDRSVHELRCPKPRLTHAGIVQLQSYNWPGNVRELHNVIERAVILASGGVLTFDLPSGDTPAVPVSQTQHTDGRDEGFLTELQMRQCERENLMKVLEKTGWRIKGPGGAAELLGIKPTTLLSRMKAMEIRRKD